MSKKTTQTMDERRKRGPRFTSEDKTATERRLVDAALELLKQNGLDALSFPRLAKWKGVDVTATAPLHYFGSRVGLLGAIAARGLNELERELRTVGGESSHSGTAVVQLAVAYAKYALHNQHLYRAIHEASLWRAIVTVTPLTDRAATRQRGWTTAAKEARDAAFDVFVRAMEKVCRKTDDVVLATRVVTCLVDGYLFQALEEQVGSRRTIAEKLKDVEYMVKLALRGLAT